ncbi:hypothetical protein FIBSPDRAFT_880034, partial [Athelia psychrophila]
ETTTNIEAPTNATAAATSIHSSISTSAQMNSSAVADGIPRPVLVLFGIIGGFS